MFLLDALLTVFGYRQDGMAEVELSIELRNDGDIPAQDAPVVTVGCTLNGGPVSGCGGPLDGLVLPDGVGREEAALRLRVPMGTELRAVLEDGTASNTVIVPERIVGVERDVWECFSDRPRRDASYENDFLGGCGGWTSGTVLKWDPEVPVRVWADPSGDPRYVRILEEVLNELALLLDLDVEWVQTEAEATLKAYVGVPSTRAASLGLDAFCQDTVGCGGPESYEDGAITSASMSVWLDGPQEAPLTKNEIVHATLHEALHALAAMHHRPAVRSVMSVNAALRLPMLSDSDEALLRLHAHPLVRPGMAMPEVQRLIVFADELLDPPPIAHGDDGIRLAERAYAAMLDAGMARFDVRGGWPDRGCEREFSGSHALRPVRSRLPHPRTLRWSFGRRHPDPTRSRSAGRAGGRPPAGGRRTVWNRSTRRHPGASRSPTPSRCSSTSSPTPPRRHTRHPSLAARYRPRWDAR